MPYLEETYDIVVSRVPVMPAVRQHLPVPDWVLRPLYLQSVWTVLP